MAWYETEIFKKTDEGWALVKTQIEKAPADVGRWGRSNELEKISSLGEKSKIKTETTKSGFNKKVTQVTSYFPDGIKVKRTLITTSSKLPKNYGKKDKK